MKESSSKNIPALTGKPDGCNPYHAYRAAEKLLEMYPWLYRLAQNVYRQRMPRDLSATQLKALLYVAGHGGTKLKSLAHDLGISMALASNSISILVLRGFVRTARPEGDRRQIALWATIAGRRAKESASDVARADVAETLKWLSPEDMELVNRALELLLDTFRHAEPVPRKAPLREAARHADVKLRAGRTKKH